MIFMEDIIVKKTYTIITIIMIFMCILINPAKVIASSQDLSWSSISGKADSFIDHGIPQNLEVGDVVNGVANVITTIGIIVVLAGLLIFGIKYMLASPEDAAKLKTKLIGLVISGLVIIGAYGIWKLAFSILDNSGIGSTNTVNIVQPATSTPTPTPTPSPMPTATPELTPTPTSSKGSVTTKDKGVEVRDRGIYLVNPFKRFRINNCKIRA